MTPLSFRDASNFPNLHFFYSQFNTFESIRECFLLAFEVHAFKNV